MAEQTDKDTVEFLNEENEIRKLVLKDLADASETPDNIKDICRISADPLALRNYSYNRNKAIYDMASVLKGKDVVRNDY